MKHEITSVSFVSSIADDCETSYYLHWHFLEILRNGSCEFSPVALILQTSADLGVCEDAPGRSNIHYEGNLICKSEWVCGFFFFFFFFFSPIPPNDSTISTFVRESMTTVPALVYVGDDAVGTHIRDLVPRRRLHVLGRRKGSRPGDSDGEAGPDSLPLSFGAFKQWRREVGGGLRLNLCICVNVWLAGCLCVCPCVCYVVCMYLCVCMSICVCMYV